MIGLYSDIPVGEGTVGDIFRIVMSVVPGVIVIGMALVVVRSYFVSWSMDRRLAAAQGVRSKWRGLLPQHVWLIGSSYLLLAAGVVVDGVARFRDPVSWRLPVFGVALWLGVVALWKMVGHQRFRRVTVDLDYQVRQARDDTPPR